MPLPLTCRVPAVNLAHSLKELCCTKLAAFHLLLLKFFISNFCHYNYNVSEFPLWHSGLMIQLVSVAAQVQTPIWFNELTDPALPQLQLRFNPWSRNFPVPRYDGNKKKNYNVSYCRLFGMILFGTLCFLDLDVWLGNIQLFSN